MSEDSDEIARFVVTKTESGQRIDVVLNRRLALGRRAVGRLFAEGRVRVDGSRVKKGALVVPGSTVSVQMPRREHAIPDPEMALDLVLVRGDLVIVNKPAGVPTAALRDNHTGTLAGAVLATFPEMRDVGFGPLEPGLVHRLDTFTSGLVIFARSANSFDRLRRALISGGLIKRYLAVVASTETPDECSIDANLEPHPKNRRKVLVSPADSRHGRPASIEFRTLRRTSRRALLEVSVGPAYRHQIRALLGFAGWPVVGDELYGAPPCSEVVPQRHALHASYIRCEGKTIEPFEVSSRLPADMSSLLGEAT